jgi:hypothetical protein
VKRKKESIKRGGWKEAPRPPLTPEGKKRRTEWLRTWNLYMSQLLFAEAERR